MCEFFSFVSDPVQNKFLYFDWDLRQKALFNDLTNYEPDSHTSIAHYFGYTAKEEDKLNKYEYNPLTDVFKVDQINGLNDSVKAKVWVKSLDFTKVVKPLIVKPIVHPFELSPPEITPEILSLLMSWDSVWDSVWDSIRNSVWASVWASVRASVRDSVWASVRDSVWDSVRDSVWAYASSFFDIDGRYDFSSSIKLWEMGLVPGFDGEVWRLHGGPDAEVLWQGVIN